ncbi:LysE family translocator [Pikeienuella piscinae]|nr:LysE family translocator [Pikeienuella piscinae]
MAETMLAMNGVALLVFLGATVVLFITPGPNMMFTIACGLSGGPRAGFAAGLGGASGMLVHIALAAAGLSALLFAAPAAYDVLRFFGAAYLFWLAVEAWRAGDALEARLGRDRPWRAYRRGLLTCLMNPKVALFMLAFLPQFIDPAIGPAAPQILVLGAIVAVMALLFDGAYGIFAGMVADRLRRASKLMNRVSAVVFGGLAARLVID